MLLVPERNSTCHVACRASDELTGLNKSVRVRVFSYKRYDDYSLRSGKMENVRHDSHACVWRFTPFTKGFFIFERQEEKQKVQLPVQALPVCRSNTFASTRVNPKGTMSSQARGLQNFISDLRNAKSKVRKRQAYGCFGTP